METYLVGGAVRDALLGLPVADRDFVVVGETPASMEAAGYRPVGSDFPVFLDPETHEEYALARTERKSGTGYRGFVVHAEPSVTLEQDLQRRDLTINAMARRADGSLVDPFGGRADLEARRLRHVSDAFVEDPVRVLRVARFMARFADAGFTVHPETLALMRAMRAAGELDHLVPERVWQETEAALNAGCPRAFIETLRAADALDLLMPELDRLFGVPQPPEHHPEIDSGEHTLLVLDRAVELSPEPVVRFAALCHDLGKGTTPPERWPSHHGHEARGVPLVEALCARLKTPKRFLELATMSARWHTHVHRVFELRNATLADLLQSLDAQRRPERFGQFLTVCEADARGRAPGARTQRSYAVADGPYRQADYLREAALAAASIDARAIAATLTDKSRVPEALRQARIDAIKGWRAARPA